MPTTKSMKRSGSQPGRKSMFWRAFTQLASSSCFSLLHDPFDSLMCPHDHPQKGGMDRHDASSHTSHKSRIIEHWIVETRNHAHHIKHFLITLLSLYWCWGITHTQRSCKGFMENVLTDSFLGSAGKKQCVLKLRSPMQLILSKQSRTTGPLELKKLKPVCKARACVLSGKCISLFGLL